ncbi:MAG: hypothetical protein QOI12_3686 [Alphaproteobacteria bacterium]|nr:hypothetical protein [Alphaproteobacteria bacterium]
MTTGGTRNAKHVAVIATAKLREPLTRHTLTAGVTMASATAVLMTATPVEVANADDQLKSVSSAAHQRKEAFVGRA